MFERLHMPPFAGAAEWHNSEPLAPAELRGHVVLVNFWTLTNWHDEVRERTLEITFSEPGAEAYAFTFG